MNSEEYKKKSLSLESLITTAPAHVYQKDINGIYIMCCDLQAKTCGYQNGREILGKTDYDFLNKHHADKITSNDKEVMQLGETLTFEEKVTLANGKQTVFLSKKTPLFESKRKCMGILGISIDITNYKIEEENKLLDIQCRVQKEKRDTKNYYENLISLMPGNAYWMDRNNVFLGCNEQQAKLAGLKSRHEIVGKTNYDMPWKEQADALNALNNKVMETGTTYTEEEDAEMIYGNEVKKRVFLSQKIPLFDSADKIIGLLGISIDITDRKKAEEYRIKHEAAQKVINFTNLMAGSIAHELRTPLAGIKINMENLQNMEFEKIPPQIVDESLKQMSGAIIKTINATSHVIDDMLLKVRSFATGKAHHKEFEEISITADIEHLLETYPFKDNEQEVVKTSYGARFKYLGDKGLTAHVLSNLIKNAIHAINECDKSDVSITIETKVEGDFNVLIFRDTAIGIPKDFVAKIFDQFETKKTTHGGTGLGLAFCRMVMEDCYGGSIMCNSEEGKYTEFVLKFPKIKLTERQL